jgi:hypothetical protein
MPIAHPALGSRGRLKRAPIMQVCRACGTTNHTAPATSLFCLSCWEALPGSAIRQVIQGVQLRGVPLS